MATAVGVLDRRSYQGMSQVVDLWSRSSRLKNEMANKTHDVDRFGSRDEKPYVLYVRLIIDCRKCGDV